MAFSTCLTPPSLPHQVYSGCICQHNTDGTHCDQCLVGFNSEPWEPGTTTDANACQGSSSSQCSSYLTSFCSTSALLYPFSYSLIFCLPFFLLPHFLVQILTYPECMSFDLPSLPLPSHFPLSSSPSSLPFLSPLSLPSSPFRPTNTHLSRVHVL